MLVILFGSIPILCLNFCMPDSIKSFISLIKYARRWRPQLIAASIFSILNKIFDIMPSPLFHIDKIKAPLLIAQGANDPRVKQHESDQIVDALENANLDVDYVLKENEGHGFSNEENILDLYDRMEKFLDKHMS